MPPPQVGDDCIVVCVQYMPDELLQRPACSNEFVERGLKVRLCLRPGFLIERWPATQRALATKEFVEPLEALLHACRSMLSGLLQRIGSRRRFRLALALRPRDWRRPLVALLLDFAKESLEVVDRYVGDIGSGWRRCGILRFT